ncbi:MAG: 50S ribosomal protein L25 [Candidatus Omnitrophota bacterium]
MEELTLDAELRQEIGSAKARDLRRAGFIPAVIYKAGEKSEPIKVPSRQLIRLLHQHRLENALIKLKIKSGKQEKDKVCLIKEIQHDPVHDNIVHVDFNEISLTQAIKVNVPVVAKGEPVGVKQEGGSLEHVLWEIEVECLPTSIPEELEVDASHLKIGDAIHVKDIVFPSGTKVLTEMDGVVMHVVAPMKEEVPAEGELEGEEKKEPEVIKEKKEPIGEAAEGKAKEPKEKETKKS